MVFMDENKTGFIVLAVVSVVAVMGLLISFSGGITGKVGEVPPGSGPLRPLSGCGGSYSVSDKYTVDIKNPQFNYCSEYRGSASDCPAAREFMKNKCKCNSPCTGDLNPVSSTPICEGPTVLNIPRGQNYNFKVGCKYEGTCTCRNLVGTATPPTPPTKPIPPKPPEKYCCTTGYGCVQYSGLEGESACSGSKRYMTANCNNECGSGTTQQGGGFPWGGKTYTASQQTSSSRSAAQPAKTYQTTYRQQTWPYSGTSSSTPTSISSTSGAASTGTSVI